MASRKDTSSNTGELVSDALGCPPSIVPFTAPTSSRAPSPHQRSSPCPSPAISPAMAEPPTSSFYPPTAKASAISADKAWRLAKEKRRSARKKLQLRGSSSQGHLAANPSLVRRCLAAALAMPRPPKKDFSVDAMPHASTGYLGVAEKIEARDFGLEELVGEGSEYGFELRRFRGSVSASTRLAPYRSLTQFSQVPMAHSRQFSTGHRGLHPLPERW